MPLALTVKKKRTVRFEGLAEFKWSDLGEQDVVGQGSFGAVLWISKVVVTVVAVAVIEGRPKHILRYVIIILLYFLRHR